MKHLRIVVPVFNDWASLEILLQHLDEAAAHLPVSVSVTVVNDGSTELPPPPLGPVSRPAFLHGVEVVDLAVNVGHQRAIAIGLCLALERRDVDAVLVMDADGEDPPEQIGALLQRAGTRSEFCIVARRRKRTESLLFQGSYRVYRAAFGLLTGKQINFGNFSLVSRGYAERLTLTPDLWNNLAAAILRSRLPIDSFPVDRGHRYTGTSKMNYASLVIHGMSGIAVYADIIFVRLLGLTLTLMCLTALTVAGTFGLRVFYPAHATPGWATTLSMGMIILLVQTIFISLSSILMLLHNRVQRLILPVQEYRTYIAGRRPFPSINGTSPVGMAVMTARAAEELGEVVVV